MSETHEPDRGTDEDEDRSPQSPQDRVPEQNDESSAHSGDSNEQVLSDSAVSDTFQEEPIKDTNETEKLIDPSSSPTQHVGSVDRSPLQGRRVKALHKGDDKRSSRMFSPSRMSWGFKLADGRYRPPETEEEWNAFYQE